MSASNLDRIVNNLDSVKDYFFEEVKKTRFGKLQSKLQAEKQVLKGTYCYTTQRLVMLSNYALLIIGCMGAAGILPVSTVGWLSLGLAGGGLLIRLAGGKLKERKITLLIDSVVALPQIMCGALGVYGILSAAQVGWGVLALPLGLIGIGVCVYFRVGFTLGYALGEKMGTEENSKRHAI